MAFLEMYLNGEWKNLSSFGTVSSVDIQSSSLAISVTGSPITSVGIINLSFNPSAIRLDQFAVPTSNLDINNKNLINVASPVSSHHATNRSYVDSKTWTSSSITDFATSVTTTAKLINLNQFAVPMASLSMNNNRITSVSDPVNPQDVTNKLWVENLIAGGGGSTINLTGSVIGTGIDTIATSFNKFQTALFSSKKQGSVLQQFVTNKAIAPKEEKDQSKISARLLCELIGSKYYPTNEEIEMDPYTVVTVYDENDQLIGHKNLIDIQKYAYDLKKDVVLRNNNVKPPVVKVMKYKITLLKRLIKKLSKKSRPEKSIAEEREKSTKIVFLSVNISKNDLDHKIVKCKDYLSHFTNLRVAVKLD
ncbi:MAG: hypothetical protein ACK5PF_11570, partial [bacterium]